MVEINPHIQQNQFYDVYKKGTGIVKKMSHVTIGQIIFIVIGDQIKIL